MSKKTAIIDIDSNSARLVIFEKSSRYGFRLICEQKSKVRIGEGAYDKGGELQPAGINRAYETLKSFKNTIKKHKTNSVIAVATSALRDAPNRDDFTQMIKSKLDISIKVISGNQEAMYGGIATANLLPYSDFISVDIGGGSSDIARVKNGIVIETCSLDIGTVRLKELFFDSKVDIKAATEYINKALKSLPSSFISEDVVGVGGTARTVAQSIMKLTDYPMNKIHAFKFKIDDHKEYLRSIIDAKKSNLDKLHIKPQRHDTIQEGVLIFLEILNKLQAKNVISSGVGVREGVYLSTLLRGSKNILPANPSVRNILDRFDKDSNKNSPNKIRIAKNIFDAISNQIEIKDKYINELNIALRLSETGQNLTIYKSPRHSSYIALHELNFGFTHKQIAIISTLLGVKDGQIKKDSYDKYKELLPSKKTLKLYGFVYNLSNILASHISSDDMLCSFENNKLTLKINQSNYLLCEEIRELKSPKSITINII